MHMSEAAATPAANPVSEGAKSGVSMLPLMVTIVFAAMLSAGGLGGAAYWLVKSGRIPLGGTKIVEVQVKPEPIKTKLVALDPLLVNLADADTHSYLRIALTLKVEDPPPDKNAKPKEEKPEKGAPKNEFEAAERDAALDILGRETGGDLLQAYGKERVKTDLLAAFKKTVPEAKVQEVLITEFLVQR
jgi:flagellar basal body-associated protein FliL